MQTSYPTLGDNKLYKKHTAVILIKTESESLPLNYRITTRPCISSSNIEYVRERVERVEETLKNKILFFFFLHCMCMWGKQV